MQLQCCCRFYSFMMSLCSAVHVHLCNWVLFYYTSHDVLTVRHCLQSVYNNIPLGLYGKLIFGLIFRVKCVPLQTSLPTSRTSWWTLREAKCVLCWRSVCCYQATSQTHETKSQMSIQHPPYKIISAVFFLLYTIVPELFSGYFKDSIPFENNQNQKCLVHTYLTGLYSCDFCSLVLVNSRWNISKFILCECFQGGYNLTSLAQSVCQTVHTLLGDPAPRLANLDGPCIRSLLSVIFRCQIVTHVRVFTLENALLSFSALESLQCVRSAHRQYWSCLSYAGITSTKFFLTLLNRWLV